MRKLTRALIYSTLLLLVACKKDTTSTNNTGTTPTGGSGTGGSGTGTTAATDNDHLLLGNPTNANTTDFNNYLIDRTYWKGGYSNDRGTPLWISWHLQKEDFPAAVSRQDDFRADNALPSGFYLVQNTSYSGSGFDRGHNCPSGDRTSTVSANSATFLMTNMIPQAPTFNQGPWAGMEDFVRNTIVGTANEAFIVMGSYGQGGVGSASGSIINTIDNGHVIVPKKVFKIVIYISKGNNDLTRIDSNAKVLAVNMPNDNRLYTTGGTTAWKNYITTINDIEADAAKEGIMYDLLRNIRATVKDYLKTKRYQ